MLQVHPRDDRRRKLSGVFATRSSDRPNPLGLHAVTVREIAPNRLRIEPIRARHREVVEAFLAAMRAGDFDGLLAMLDPDVVVRAEGAEGVREIRGARNWAKGALAFSRQARFMQPALVGGKAGLVLAPGGRLSRAVRFTIANGKIVEVEVIANPERLRELDLAVLDD